ncbi:SDR family oxidoreductase [Nocardia africana]|uniref:SDR family oxidoreductase n=1 Tax=Nocardia africana TaxID=134964 RepID=A0ABW6NMV3_9NOCA
MNEIENRHFREISADREAPVLVVGARGRVGRSVVRSLVSCGQTVRALTRHPNRMPATPNVEVVEGELFDMRSLRSALAGVRRVFLLWPFPGADHAAAVIDTIAETASRCVLLSSGLVGDNGCTALRGLTVAEGHTVAERLIQQVGMEWTILRPASLMANNARWAAQLTSGDTVCGTYGDLPMAPVHEADVAAVAVHALLGDGHHQRRYHLTGPEVLTQKQQLSLLGRHLKRALRWKEITLAEYREHLLATRLLHPDCVEAVLRAHSEMAAGGPVRLTTAVSTVTRRPPCAVEDWVRENAWRFR